jgi:hypothetical protein
MSDLEPMSDAVIATAGAQIREIEASVKDLVWAWLSRDRQAMQALAARSASIACNIEKTLG